MTDPLGGARNMAIDEALLAGRRARDGCPTVRFYGWRRPTVSVGYGQALSPGVDLDYCARVGIDIVRRVTGGSAILHETPEREVTYSVVAGPGDFAGADDVLETYRVIGNGLARGFARLGLAVEVVPLVRSAREAAPPTFCFDRTGAYEIAAGGKKLVGSAQRRRSGAFLQHGSILLGIDPERLRAVFPRVDGAEGRLATLGSLLGRAVGGDEVVAALAAGLGAALSASLEPGELLPGERERVERLVADKYGNRAWTEHGREIATGPAARPSLVRS